MKANVLTTLALLFVSSSILAQNPSSFDGDHDGFLSVNELSNFLAHTKIKKISKADIDKDGRIDTAPVKSFLAEMSQTHGAGPYTFAQVNSKFPPSKSFDPWGILLRESHEDITASSDILPISKVKAATLSYAYDYPTKSSTWMMKGALMRPFFSEDENRAVVPSITFNRIISDDSTKEANSFVPRLGYHQFINSDNVLQILRLFINYGTDFSFESSQYGVEFEYEPVFVKLPFGRYYTVVASSTGSALEIRTKVFAQFQGGYVEKTGNKENLKAESGYFRAGGKGVLDVRLFEKLELTGGYTYLHAFEGSPEKSRHKVLGASYTLGENGNVAIKMEYQYGNIPITQEEVENLTIGFGIKF